MRSALFFVALASIASLPAQTSFTGPVEAITFDQPTRSVRAVIGFPGAASFGPALLDNLDLASVAPGQSYGLLFRGGICQFVTGLGTAKVSSTAISGVTAHPEGLVWAANGSAAILYSRAGNWVQVLTGLPSTPSAEAVVEVPAADGSLVAVAADPAGKQIVVATAGASGGVFELSNGQLSALVSTPDPLSLAFSNDAQTLFALDGAKVEVLAVNIASRGFQVLPLDGIANPVAIATALDSENRQLLYVAGGTDRLLRIIDVASEQTVTDVALHFQPACIVPFGGGSFVLAYREQSSSPLWLFASTPQPAAYFVPAVQLHQPDRRSSVAGGTR
jgi:hypothetical protein